MAVRITRYGSARRGATTSGCSLVFDGSEDNGVHVGLDGRWPESGQRWQTVQKQQWAWDCKQRTRAGSHRRADAALPRHRQGGRVSGTRRDGRGNGRRGYSPGSAKP